MSMETIEQLTKAFSAARDRLAEAVMELEREIEILKARHMPAIRAHVRQLAREQDELRSAIEDDPKLWSGKRRTVVIAGIRVGLAKGKGKIVWQDSDRVVAAIHRAFPDQAMTLVRVREEPNRKALANLTVAELRRIGCEIEDSDDQVVIKPTDTAVDKLVDALLKDAERVEESVA